MLQETAVMTWIVVLKSVHDNDDRKLYATKQNYLDIHMWHFIRKCYFWSLFKQLTLKVVLIDEYQDTNLMQESLYFELA